MKRTRNNKPTHYIEHSIFSWETLFKPTIEMAAEIMNVSTCVIKEWLDQENCTFINDRLDDSAIDFLAKKYVVRLHRYFDNCTHNWKDLDDKDRDLFNEFRTRYSKNFFIRASEWKAIDYRRIERDFKDELESKAYDAFFAGHNIIKFELLQSDITTAYKTNVVKAKDERVLLYLISHNLYYLSRKKTTIPIRPEYRDIVIEILIENRFHIFSGESDSNVLIDAMFHLFVKQPLLAIADVFGYTRHKNTTSHDYFKKEKAYCCR